MKWDGIACYFDLYHVLNDYPNHISIFSMHSSQCFVFRGIKVLQKKGISLILTSLQIKHIRLTDKWHSYFRVVYFIQLNCERAHICLNISGNVSGGMTHFRSSQNCINHGYMCIKYSCLITIIDRDISSCRILVGHVQSVTAKFYPLASEHVAHLERLIYRN